MNNIDDFLKKELNIKGKILNLIHHLSYGEIKRICLKYAGLQQTDNADIPTSKNQPTDSEAKTGGTTE